MSNPVIVDLVKDIFAERHALTRWLRLNASANRNLPSDESPVPPVRVIHEHVNQPPVPAPVPPVIPAVVETPAATVPPNWPMWLKSLIAAGGLGTAGLAGAGISYLTTKPVAPVEKPAEKSDPSGSVLQYLEDEGYHLPKAKQ